MDLRGTMVRVLPASIVDLGKLVHLLTDENVTFPDGIVKLQSLEVLKQVSVFKQTFNFMQELGRLMNLRMMCIDFKEHKPMDDDWMGCPRIVEDVPIEDTFDATEWEEPIASFFRGFVSLKNLQYLKITSGGRFLPSETMCQFPVSLHKLFLFLYPPFSNVPEWIPSLVNLQELRIDVKAITHNGLCILGSLPALLKLELKVRYYDSEDTIVTVSGEVGFPYLKKLQYGTSSRGMDLKFEAGSMPKLETLVFSVGASYIMKSDTFGFDFGIINLPSLVTLECRASGDYRFKAAIKSAASTHPNRPTVLFPEIHL